MSAARRSSDRPRLLGEVAAWILVLGLGAATAAAADDPPSKQETSKSQEAARATVLRKAAGAASASSATAEHISGSAGATTTPLPAGTSPSLTKSVATGSARKTTPPATTARPATLGSPRGSEERHLLNREVYVYKTVGRRDPFASLLEGEFETTVGRPLLDVSSMKLVGIVWGTSDKFALIEDGRGHGHVLRVGDPVINGYVVGLTKTELMVRQTSYGDSQTVTIQLQRKEGTSNE